MVMMQQQDAVIAKILTPKQQARIKQISLQREGMFVLARPEMAQKLNMDEGQIAQIQEIMDEMRGAQRETFTAQMQTFQQFRRADGSFDRDAMKAQRESPEGQAQAAKAQKDAEKLRNQASTALGKVLRKKQKADFKKMTGAPFDLTKLVRDPNGFPGAPRARGVNPDPNAAGAPKAKALAEDAEEDEDAPKAKAAAPAEEDSEDDAPKPAPTAKKKAGRRKAA